MRTEARKTLLIGCMNSAHIAEAATPVRDAELAVATRGGMIESRHRGTVVVLSPGGDVILALGDAHRPIFARSTLKPFQAIGALKAGAPLRGAQVAIACASHRGTFEQMRAVQEALAAAGLSADAFQCPAVYPTDSGTRATMLQAGLAKTPLAFECSGKHAAFLWACAAKSERGELEPDAALWSIDAYLDPQHPLQRMIVEEVEAFTGEQVAHASVDGCGAPVFALSPVGLARAYATLGTAIRNMEADARASTVATAMVDYPELIQGPDSPDTVVSERLDAVVKSGAEGMLCIGLRSGASAVVKISDGSSRATHLVALRALQAAGFLTQTTVDSLLTAVLRPITGGVEDGQPRTVGELVPGTDLAAVLAGVAPAVAARHGSDGACLTAHEKKAHEETTQHEKTPGEPDGADSTATGKEATGAQASGATGGSAGAAPGRGVNGRPVRHALKGRRNGKKGRR